MKLKTIGLLSAVSIMASVASCAGGSGSKGDVEVIFWTTFDQAVNRKIESYGQKFAEYIKETEGVKVSIVADKGGDYDAIYDKVTKGLSSGNLPTMAIAYPDHVANYLSKDKSYIVNLDEYINHSEYGLGKEGFEESNKGIEDFVESFVEEGQGYKYEGTYSFPFLKSTEIMLYNADIVNTILRDMEIQSSVKSYMDNLTWDQLIDMLEFVAKNPAKYHLTDDDARPLYYDSDANLYITQSYQRNIPYISMNDDGVGQFDFVNDEAKAMVTELKDLYDRKILLTKATNSGQYSSAWFTNYKSIFIVGSSGGVAHSDPQASFDIGVCKFPAYKTATAERSKYISQGPTVTLINNKKYSDEKNKQNIIYTWKFLKYLENASINIDLALGSGGYIPVRKSAYEDEEYAEYISETDPSVDYMGVCAGTVVNQINGNYFNYPVFKGSAEARDAMEALVSNVFDNTWTIDEAFTKSFETATKASVGQ